MSSLFDTDYAAAVLPALLEVHGSAAIYTPAGGSPVSLTGLTGPVELVEADVLEGLQEQQTRTLTISIDAGGDYGGIAAPAIHDTVQIDSVDWDVAEVAPGHATVTLTLVRHPSVEKSRPNFRQRA